VATIAEAMMSAGLDSLSSYRERMCEASLTVTAAEDITRHVEHTWVHCARIGEIPFSNFWYVLPAARRGASLKPSR
jgi:hypothetical protein